MAQNEKSLLNKMRQGERPIVYVNVCTHGNEKVGVRVLKALEDVSVKKGTLIMNVANKKAFSLNKRFIDADLNRVFPGKPDGNHEERLACELMPLIKAADIVIDIHSTESGTHSSLIVMKLDESTLDALYFVNPKRVLVMSATKNSALISSAKVGIGFEYGKDEDETMYRKILEGIMNILSGLGMAEGGLRKKRLRTEFYMVSEPLKKEKGFVIVKSIRNFSLVRCGEVVARNGESELLAPKDFYPILFGKNTYTEIFGFMGEKLEVSW